MESDWLAAGLAAAYFGASFAFAAYVMRRMGDFDRALLDCRAEVENLKRMERRFAGRGKRAQAKRRGGNRDA